MAIYGTQEGIDTRYAKQIVDHKNRRVTSRGVRLDFDLAPHIPMENITDKSSLVAILSGADDTLCQVFKASADNIHDIDLVLQGTGTTDDLDNFESYADTPALVAEWVASDPTNTFVTLDTGTVHGGSQNMGIQCRKNQSSGDTITKDYGAGGIDYSSYESLSFWVFNDIDLTCIWKINLIDTSANVASLQYNQANNVWTKQDLSLFDFSNFAGMDWENIRYVQFEMVRCTSALHTFYIDDMELNGPAGDIDIEIIDFGATAPVSTDNIVSAGDILTLDEGASSVTYSLPLTKSVSTHHIHYGSHEYGNSLTIGNYYGIHIKAPSSGICAIYGSSTKKYNSGGCFTVNGSDIMTEIAKSINFMIFCIYPAYLSSISIETDGVTGNTVTNICTCDLETGKGVDYIMRHVFNNETSFNSDFIKNETQLFYTDRRFVPSMYYEDHTDSEVESFSLHLYYIYEPVEENG